jgi:hypothetical protein
LGGPRFDLAVEKRIQAQLRAKKGLLAIARDLKVGTGTVQRVIPAAEAEGEQKLLHSLKRARVLCRLKVVAKLATSLKLPAELLKMPVRPSQRGKQQ